MGRGRVGIISISFLYLYFRLYLLSAASCYCGSLVRKLSFFCRKKITTFLRKSDWLRRGLFWQGEGCQGTGEGEGRWQPRWGGGGGGAVGLPGRERGSAMEGGGGEGGGGGGGRGINENKRAFNKCETIKNPIIFAFCHRWLCTRTLW